jgi:hypothetical protein
MIVRTVIIALLLSATAAAQTTPTFVPVAPGSPVARQLVALDGLAHARWEAVASKKLVGTGNGRDFYQWYLSIYAPRAGAYRIRYQSPRNGGPLERVAQANGAKMWFPVQDLKIVGAAQLMRKHYEQLVVSSHAMAADCGSATVTVFTAGTAGRAVPAVTVTNSCDLAVKIVNQPDGPVLELRGPYYGAGAPLCCPTNAKATAVLGYRHGKWSETPNYFKVEGGPLGDERRRYIRKTPNWVRGCGACAAASRPIAMTRRVSSGSMMPSSHSRAVE